MAKAKGIQAKGNLPQVPKGWKRREQERGAFWSPWATPAEVKEHGLVADNPLTGSVRGWREIKRSGQYAKEGVKQSVCDLDCEGLGFVTVKINGDLPGKLGEKSGLGAGEIVRVQWLGKEEPSKAFPQGVHHYDVLTRE